MLAQDWVILDVADIITDAKSKINNSKSEQERIDIANEARDRVSRAQKKFESPKSSFKEAEDLFVSDDGKEEAKEAQAECDRYAYLL